MNNSDLPLDHQHFHDSVSDLGTRLTMDLCRFFPRSTDADARRRDQLLEVNSLATHATDPHAASARALEFITEEVRDGPSEEGEHHIRMLCMLIGSVETRRLIAMSHRELGDMLGLYHQTRRQLIGLSDSRHAAAILARSTVPYLADVCVVDLAEDHDPETLRRAVVEASHLISDAGPIKAALAAVDEPSLAPHDPRLVTRTGSCRMVSDISEEDLVSASSTQRQMHALRLLAPTSYLCVPLGGAGAPAGAMTLLRARPGNTYSDSHRLLAAAIGELYEEVTTAAVTATTHASPPQPSVNRAAQNGYAGSDPALAQVHLTPRELEILKLINQGYSRKAITKRLKISEKTYDSHTSRIREKLQVENNLKALAAARAAGLVHD